MPVATATTVLTVRDRKLQAGLRRGLASLRRFGQRAKVIMKVAALAIAGIGLAAVASAVLFLKAFEVQEKAERKLEAVIKATGMAAGFTAEQMKKMASALQVITSIGDEVILNAQAILATFKEIKGEEFKDATLAILDMATVLDTDLKSAAILVGKALNDPIKGAAALSRSGVTFTKVQIEQIRVMQEAGDVMGAQRLILNELESQFKGAAEALGSTFGGRVRELIGRLGDLTEQMGAPLVNVVDDLIEKVSELATFLENNIDIIQAWTESFGGVGDAIVRILILVKDVALGFGLLGNAMLQVVTLNPFNIMRRGIIGVLQDLKKLRADYKLMAAQLEDPLKVFPQDLGPAEREARKKAAREALIGTRAGKTTRGGGVEDKEGERRQKASFEDLQQMAKRIQTAAAGGDPQTKAAVKTADAAENMVKEIIEVKKEIKKTIPILENIFDKNKVMADELPGVGTFAR